MRREREGKGAGEKGEHGVEGLVRLGGDLLLCLVYGVRMVSCSQGT